MFSHWGMSDSLWPHRLQHTRLPCLSPFPGVCSNSYSSSRWCLPTISSSVVPFSSCLQSFPASGSGSFQMSPFTAFSKRPLISFPCITETSCAHWHPWDAGRSLGAGLWQFPGLPILLMAYCFSTSTSQGRPFIRAHEYAYCVQLPCFCRFTTGGQVAECKITIKCSKCK